MERTTDQHQLEQILALVREILGSDLAGAYLHGSGAFGGLKPRSDVDVLVVSRRSLASVERRRLTVGLMALSGSGRDGRPRPIELTVVVASEVTPWRYPPMQDYLYGEWLRADYVGGQVPQAEPNPDLAPLIAMTLMGDRPLIGPPPAELLDLVPHADLLRAITAGIDGLLADLEPDTANVILTLARVWLTVVTGEIRSKDAAADWAMARLAEPDRAVLARARAIYLGEEAYHWEDLRAHVRPAADHMVAEIQRAPPAAHG